MIDFESKNNYIQLFDIYGKLLTEKQKEYFQLYFLEDYSLSEIAELNLISRSAVYDSILKIIKHLEKLEDILRLNLKINLKEQLYVKYYNKYKELIDQIKKIDEME